MCHNSSIFLENVVNMTMLYISLLINLYRVVFGFIYSI